MLIAKSFEVIVSHARIDKYIWAIFARHKICENKVTGLFFLKFLKENNNGYNFCLILLYFWGCKKGKSQN